MTKWYEQRYVNRRDWVLENLEYLGLNGDELIIVMLIDYMNDNHMDISMEGLGKKTQMNPETVDKIVSSLCSKNFLSIKSKGGSVRFSLDGLFEANIKQQKNVLESPLFDLFASEFNRPLTQLEMQKISDWSHTMDSEIIVYALREASAYRKLNIKYIDAILKEWSRKNITIEMLEKGQH